MNGKKPLGYRILSILLCAMMVTSTLPSNFVQNGLNVFAEEDENGNDLGIGVDVDTADQSDISNDEAYMDPEEETSLNVLVKTDDESIFGENATVVANYDDVYVVSYEDANAANELVENIGENDIAFDMSNISNSIMLQDEESTSTDSEQEVVMSSAEETVTDVVSNLGDNIDEISATDYSGYVALIDSGADADANVSVIGDDTTDHNGHGTRMLECIKAENPDAKVLSIKAFNGSVSDVVSVYAAIKLAIESKVSVINLSFVTTDIEANAILKEVIQEALDNGITVIGAAGNLAADCKAYIPGCIDGVITVGAANEDGTLYATSNYNADLYVVAESTSEATAKYSGIYTSGKTSNEVFDKLAETKVDDISLDEANFDDAVFTTDKAFLVKYTFVDSKVTAKYDDYDDIMQNEPTSVKQFVTVCEPVYKQNNVYMIDVSHPWTNGLAAGEIFDYDFANANNDGEAVTSGVKLDTDKKIAYIDEDAFSNEEFADGQLQVVIPVDERTVDLQVRFLTDSGNVIETKTLSTSSYFTLCLDVDKEIIPYISRMTINGTPTAYAISGEDSLLCNKVCATISSVDIYLNDEVLDNPTLSRNKKVTFSTDWSKVTHENNMFYTDKKNIDRYIETSQVLPDFPMLGSRDETTNADGNKYDSDNIFDYEKDGRGDSNAGLVFYGSFENSSKQSDGTYYGGSYMLDPFNTKSWGTAWIHAGYGATSAAYYLAPGKARGDKGGFGKLFMTKKGQKDNDESAVLYTNKYNSNYYIYLPATCLHVIVDNYNISSPREVNTYVTVEEDLSGADFGFDPNYVYKMVAVITDPSTPYSATAASGGEVQAGYTFFFLAAPNNPELELKKELDENSIPAALKNSPLYKASSSGDTKVSFQLYEKWDATNGCSVPIGSAHTVTDGTTGTIKLDAKYAEQVIYVKETHGKALGDISSVTGGTKVATNTFSVKIGKAGTKTTATAYDPAENGDPNFGIEKVFPTASGNTKLNAKGVTFQVRYFDEYFTGREDLAACLTTLSHAGAGLSKHKVKGEHNTDYWTTSGSSVTSNLVEGGGAHGVVPGTLAKHQATLDDRYNTVTNETFNYTYTAYWEYQTGSKGRFWMLNTTYDDTYGGKTSGTLLTRPSTGKTFWPIGTYVVSEIKAGNSVFLNPSDVSVVTVKPDGTRDYMTFRYDPVTGDYKNAEASHDSGTFGNQTVDTLYNDDMPKFGAFTISKTLKDIKNIPDKDEADENGNDAGIDVDKRNNEIIVQGQLYCVGLKYGNTLMYWPDGETTADANKIEVTFADADKPSPTNPYLISAGKSSGSKANGNWINNGKIQMVKHYDPETKKYEYEFRTPDLAISPGDYRFVETDVATGFKNDYPGPATDEKNCFSIHVDENVRSLYADAFKINGDASVADDHSLKDGVVHGTVDVKKMDRDWDIYSGRVQYQDKSQGDGELYAEFAIWNMNNNSVIVSETSSDSFTDKVGSKQIVGYMYTDRTGKAQKIYRLAGQNAQEPSSTSRPATYNSTTGQWTLKSNAVKITLPWGNYAIEETTQPKGYVSVDANFNNTYGRTKGGDPFSYSNNTDPAYVDSKDVTGIKVRKDGQVAAFTYDTGVGSTSSISGKTIFTDGSPAIDQIIRGGIYVEKTDFDALVDVYTPEGNGAFSDLGFIVKNQSTWDVWVDLNDNELVESTEIFAPGADIISADNEYSVNKNYTFTISYDSDTKRYCFTSPNDFLPYGTYDIREQTDQNNPESGYHMLDANSKGTRRFYIRQNNTIEDGNKFAFTENNNDKSFANPVKRAGIIVDKKDKDGNMATPEGDATLEGAVIAIWNTSNESVVTDQNSDGQLSEGEREDRVPQYTEDQINQAINNGLSKRTNSLTKAEEWYGKDNNNVEVRTCLIIKTDANGVAQTSKIALPYGDYIVREVQAPAGYHVDTNFRLHVTVTDDVTTAESTKDGEVRIPPDTFATINWQQGAENNRVSAQCVRDGKLSDLRPLGAKYERNLTEHYDETLNAFTTESRTTIYDRVIRGSFIVQKVDEDDWKAYNDDHNGYTNLYLNDDGKYVIEQQGDGSFEGAEFDVVNTSDHDIITYTYNATGDLVKTTYHPQDVVWHFQLDGNGYYEAPDDLLPYGSYTIVETKPSEGYNMTNLQHIDFSIGRAQDGSTDIITINDELSRENTENDLILSLDGYNIKHIAGAKYQITSASSGQPVANKTFTIKSAMEDDIYIFNNGEKKVNSVSKIAPGENVYGTTQVKTDEKGVCILRQLTAHLGGTDYLDGTQYTLEGGLTGTLTVKLDDYTQRFIANLTTNTEYDKYPITEPIKRGGLNVRKVDEDEWDNTGRCDKAQGDATLAGAVFSIYNISDRYTWVKDETSDWRRTWPLTDDGEWQGQQNVEADKVYDPDEEIRRIDRKKINTILHTGMTTEGNSVKSYDGTYTDLVEAYNGAVSEDVIANYHQEDKERLFENDMLELVKNNTAVLKITTDANGIASTAQNALPYGTYLVVETETSEGYMLPRNWYRIVEVREDGHMYTWEETNTEYTLNVDTKVTKEPVVRGDVQIMKYDAELNAPHSLTENGLEGIQYKIYNVSDSYTYLWELTNYRNDSLVDTTDSKYNTPIKIVNSEMFNPTSSEFWRNLDSDTNNYVTTITTHWNPTHKWTDDDGVEHVGAYTAETYQRNEDGTKKLWKDDKMGAIRGALPYGTYLIRESKTNTKYNFTDVDAWIFQVREECETVEIGWRSGDTASTAKHVMHTDNYIERNDIWFNKIGDGDSVRLDTMWVIKNEDTGERHVIVTNSGSNDDNTGNGTYESGADVKPHTNDTNGNDVFLKYIDDNNLLDTNVKVTSEFDAKKNGNAENLPVAITMGSESDFYDIEEKNEEGQKDTVKTKVLKEKYEGIELDNNGLGLAHYDAGTWFGWCEFTTTKTGESPNKFIQAGTATEELVVHDDVTGEDIVFHWAKPDDSLKAFPYGHYTISEVRTDSNMDYDLQSYTFEVNNANTDLSKWYTENVVRDREIDLGTITDDFKPEIEVSTLLTDVMTESHVSDAKSDHVVLNDEVEYVVIGDAAKLTKHKDYKLVAELHEAVKAEDGTWTAGEEVIATTTADDFRIKGNYGKYDVKYEFDASAKDLEGKTLVSTVYIYQIKDGEETLIGKAEEASDVNEHNVYPLIKTEFTSLATDGHVVPVGKDVTITDKVIATNLYPDTKYAVSAALMYKDEEGNAHPVLGEDGEPITTGIMPYKFISEDNAEFVATFKHVDTTKYQGDKLVAYAYLYVNDEVVARHEDIADESETVYVPEIHTDAIDGVSGDQQGVVAKTDKVEDVITFKNLEVGKKYYAVGELYEVDAEGNVVPVMIKSEDGTTTPVRGWTAFEPTSEDENVKITEGQVKVTFDIDSTEYAGKNIVVYETVYGGNLEVGEDEEITIEKIINNLTEIANHTEPTDERQTIHYPEISTSANDANTGTKSALALKETKLVDTITYKNLIVGAEYKFQGTIMTKDDEGNAVPVLDGNGEPVTVTSKTFVPETTDGTYDIEFVFDATDYVGKSVTVFEKLLSAKTDVEYTQHEDIEDGEQTVHFPKIGTQAKDATTGDEIGYATENTTISDTVMFENLVPGLTYKVVGVLYDKETGKPIKKSEVEKHTDTDAEPNNDVTPTDSTDDRELDITDKRELIVGKDIEAGYYKIEGGDVDSLVNGDKYGYWCIYVSKDGKTVPTERTVDTTLTNGIVTGDKVHYIRVADNMVLQLDSHAVYTKVTAEEAEPNLNDTVKRYFEDLDKVTETTVADAHTTSDATSTDATSTDATSIDETDGVDHTTDVSYVNNDNVDDTLVTAYTYFVCASENGTVDVALTFDATGFKGRDVVVFEKLYLVTAEGTEEVGEDTPNRKEIELAQHEDINDLGQTIIYPDVHTEALDRDTKLHEAEAKKETVIVDKVFCSNLIKDKEYTISGYLVNKETGAAICDAEGKQVSAELTFVAEQDGDCVKELEFKFDASLLKGQTLVAFETLKHNNVPVAVHEDIHDEAQTVYFPDIKTVATSLASGAKLLDPIEAEKINDEVKYENLIIGHKYRIEGKLVDVETGEVIKGTDGKELSGSIEFTATVANGSVFVEFGNVNAQTYKGKQIVVIETLYNVDTEEAKKLVEHNELDDKDQTVDVTNPTVNTVLAETDTDNKAIAANGTVKLTDKISYTDLIPGNEYVVVSTLVDKSTGKTLQDDNKKDITVESTIKPEKSTAVIDAKFNFKGETVKGKVVVAYNDLYRVIDGERYLVVSEHDLENANQTVTFPEIGTTATDAENKTHTLTCSTKAVINDEVEYKGLEIGKEYTLTATPYDKETGKPLTGVEPVSIKFVAAQTNGTVNIQVTVDTTKLAGKKIVMFESVSYEGKEIAVHNDINDEAQTVTVCKIGTTLTGADKKSKTVDIGQSIVLIDTVKFEGLTPGVTYVLSGEIIDKNAYTGTPVTATEKTDKGKTATTESNKPNNDTTDVDTKAAATDKTEDSSEVTYPEGRKKPTEFMKGVTMSIPETVGGNQNKEDRMKVTSYALTEYSKTPDVNSDYKLDVTCILAEYGSKTDTFKGASTWESTVECFDKDGKVISTTTISANIEKGVGTTITDEVRVPVDTTKIVFYEKPSSTSTEKTTEATTQATTEQKTTQSSTTTVKSSTTSDYSKSVIAKNSIEFTPTTADGTVEISFTIDTSNLNGHSLVAFETVSEKTTGQTIATHKDINDEDQTVTVKTKPNVQTGVQRLAFIFAILALLGLAGFAYYTKKQMKLAPVKVKKDDDEE